MSSYQNSANEDLANVPLRIIFICKRVGEYSRDVVQEYHFIH